MGYYVRVLTVKPDIVPVSQIQKRLADEGLAVRADLEAGEADDDWVQVVLRHKADGVEIAAIERDIVEPGELGEAEIEEFQEEIEDARPESAVEWLTQYLPHIKVIYAFQLLSGTDRPGGWEAVHAVMDELHSRLGGITQADAEGFTNEEGHHILWQFHDNVDGPYEMAILEEGKWRAFEMDLANPAHRKAFLNGRVPDGVTLL